MRIQWFPFCEVPSDNPGSGGTPSGSSSTITGSDIAAAAEPATAVVPSIDPKEFDTYKTKAEKLSWAEAYDNPDDVKSAVELRKWFATDPEGAYDFVTGHMKRAGLIKEPVAPKPHVAPDGLTDPQTGEPLPDFEVKETGAKFYSAAQSQKHAAWVREELRKEFKPATDFVAHETQTREVTQTANAMISDAWDNWPHFKDFATEINAELQKDGRATLESAYRRIVVPQLQRKEREQVAADLKAKGKSSTHNPGSMAPASTVDESKLSTKDLLKRELEKRRRTA